MSKDKPKGGLGKGLDILFGGSESAEQSVQEFHKNVTELNPKSDEQILFLEISGIRANPYQPRKEFDHPELNELADSIRQKGIIQAITVRKLDDGNYELISGERRLRAATIAGLDKIPAYVLDVN